MKNGIKKCIAVKIDPDILAFPVSALGMRGNRMADFLQIDLVGIYEFFAFRQTVDDDSDCLIPEAAYQ